MKLIWLYTEIVFSVLKSVINLVLFTKLFTDCVQEILEYGKRHPELSEETAHQGDPQRGTRRQHSAERTHEHDPLLRGARRN